MHVAVLGLVLVCLAAAIAITTPWELELPYGPFGVREGWAEPSDDPPAPAGPVPPAPATSPGADLESCCSASRDDLPVDAIVVHTSEMNDQPGGGDLAELGRFMERRGVGAHAATSADGTSIRMLDDGRAAFHATYWNSTTLGLELIGFARFSREEWLARDAQLTAAARWIAHWAREHRVPIRRCVVTGPGYDGRRVSEGLLERRGICSHAELDPRNRSDPGAGFPWDVVLARARAIADRA